GAVPGALRAGGAGPLLGGAARRAAAHGVRGRGGAEQRRDGRDPGMMGGAHPPQASARQKASPSLTLRVGVRRPVFSILSATVCRLAVLTRCGVIDLSALALAERQTTMKKLFALTALCLSGALPLHAADYALGRPDDTKPT